MHDRLVTKAIQNQDPEIRGCFYSDRDDDDAS